MKKEDQLVSLELSKKIDKLKFNQDSNFYWQKLIKGKSAKWELVSDMDGKALKNALIKNYVEKQYRAYSAVELGEILPFNIEGIKSKPLGGYGFSQHIYTPNGIKKWGVSYCDFKGELINSKDDSSTEFIEISEADARAKLIIYLKENNLI